MVSVFSDTLLNIHINSQKCKVLGPCSLGREVGTCCVPTIPPSLSPFPIPLCNQSRAGGSSWSQLQAPGPPRPPRSEHAAVVDPDPGSQEHHGTATPLVPTHGVRPHSGPDWIPVAHLFKHREVTGLALVMMKATFSSSSISISSCAIIHHPPEVQAALGVHVDPDKTNTAWLIPTSSLQCGVS